MTDADTIRGLQETIAAQAQRLAEIAKLYDLAHEAKVYLIGEHKAEREKRQQQALEIDRLRLELARHQRERHESLEAKRQAEQQAEHARWNEASAREAVEDHEKNEAHLRQTMQVAVDQARVVISDLQSLCRRVADGESNAAEAYAVFERADAWLEAHPEAR